MSGSDIMSKPAFLAACWRGFKTAGAEFRSLKVFISIRFFYRLEFFCLKFTKANDFGRIGKVNEVAVRQFVSRENIYDDTDIAHFR